MYYLQGTNEKINQLVEPHLSAIDIAPEMLAFYAFSKNEAGDIDLAKSTLAKAKQLGLSKKSLGRVIRDPNNTKEFISKLSNVGIID